MTHRFFRATEEVYEGVRLTLDEAWGLPNDIGTVTCFEPAATGLRDENNLLVLAVRHEFCQFSVASDLLPQLLAAGAIEEIEEAAYRAALPQTP
jgi:hypothetical protein